MELNNLKPAKGSTHHDKRVGIRRRCVPPHQQIPHRRGRGVPADPRYIGLQGDC